MSAARDDGSAYAPDMGRDVTDDIAQRHGFSPGAVASLAKSMAGGLSGMAQFDHPEFGGPGQWIRGGMTMVSSSNAILKGRVDMLCQELAQLLAATPAPAEVRPRAPAPARPIPERPIPERPAPAHSGSAVVPGEWGPPDSSGAQGSMRYAFFAEARRLVVESDGAPTIYDTLDHRVGGVSQQQSQGHSLSFRSQHGLVDLDSLPVVPATGMQADAAPPAGTAPVSPVSRETPGIIAALEGIAALHAKGVLTAEEFAAKKAELLARL